MPTIRDADREVTVTHNDSGRMCGTHTGVEIVRARWFWCCSCC